MTRVAIMYPTLGRYGGAEQFGYRLAAYLASEFEVTFVCSRQKDPAPDGVRVVRVGRPLPGKCAKVLWFAVAADLARRLGKHDVAIGLGNTVFQDILRLSGGPTRLFWDASIQAYPPGWRQWMKSLSRRLSPGKQLGRLIERLQLRHSRIVVANSAFVRDLTVQAFPRLRPEQIRLIYNQPDLKRFSPSTADQKPLLRRQFALPEHVRLLTTAATNFRLKGVHVLLQALALLPPEFHLAVAGGRGGRELRDMAARLAVQDRLHLLGRVDDMPNLYRASDMFVLNSFYDACANAVLEAAACGLPVLSTTCNGSSAFLRPEAVLPDPTDADTIARRILHLWKQGPTARDDFFPTSGLEPYAELIRSMA